VETESLGCRRLSAAAKATRGAENLELLVARRGRAARLTRLGGRGGARQHGARGVCSRTQHRRRGMLKGRAARTPTALGIGRSGPRGSQTLRAGVADEDDLPRWSRGRKGEGGWRHVGDGEERRGDAAVGMERQATESNRGHGRCVDDSPWRVAAMDGGRAARNRGVEAANGLVPFFSAPLYLLRERRKEPERFDPDISVASGFSGKCQGVKKKIRIEPDVATRLTWTRGSRSQIEPSAPNARDRRLLSSFNILLYVADILAVS
jgi:hypothetical protein